MRSSDSTFSGARRFRENRAAKWLQDSQNGDGGWGYSRNDGQSGWTTAWGILALASLGDLGSDESHLKSVGWLLDVAVAVSSQDTLEEIEELLAVDGSLHGWPWQADQASWVEPTSLTILALRSAGFVEGESRVDGGLAYLTNRRCSNGGWNVGNPRMFDQELPPGAVPSACALLALARCKPTLIDSTDVEALKQEIDQDASVLALAWGVMALRVLEEESTDFISALADLQLPDGSWNRNSYHTALAAMAFGEEVPICLTG